jgi:hypothetical protein
MKQCSSCGGDCGHTKAKGCQHADATSKKQWVGLTDAEIEELDMEIDGTVYDFVHAVEDKLRDKNK